MRKIKTKKNIAQFVVVKSGVPEVIGEKLFIIGESRNINFKKRSFPIIFDVPAFRKGNIDYFLFDYNSPNQLITREMLIKGGFIENKDGTFEFLPISQMGFVQELENSEKFIRALRILNVIANEEVIEKLLRATEIKRNWIDIIMGAVAGGGVCLFIGYMLAIYL